MCFKGTSKLCITLASTGLADAMCDSLVKAEVTPKSGSVIRVVLQDGDAFSISHAISIAHDSQATMATTRLKSGSEFARAISSPFPCEWDVSAFLAPLARRYRL